MGILRSGRTGDDPVGLHHDPDHATTGAAREAGAAEPTLPELAERLTDVAAELLATSASQRALQQQLERLLAEGADQGSISALSSEARLLKERVALLTRASAEARKNYEVRSRACRPVSRAPASSPGNHDPSYRLTALPIDFRHSGAPLRSRPRAVEPGRWMNQPTSVSGEGALVSSRIRLIQASLVTIVAGATLLVAAIPALSFAYRAPEAHVAFETAAALVTGLAAFILFGRLNASRTRGELALFGALVMLAAANLLVAITPAFSGADSERGAVWVPLSAHLLAAASLAYAAWYADRRPLTPRAVRVVALLAAGATLLIGAVALVAASLPTGLGLVLAPTETDSVQVVGSPGLLTLQALVTTLFGVAAFGFTRAARSSGDDLLGWLGIAAALSALARVNYLLFPSIYTEYVYIGDFLRLAAYAAVLVGALRQIAAYQRLSARTAIAEERSRMARDFHDGLAQDLAFIAMAGRRLAGRDPEASTIADAAEQALRASRAAIVQLREGEEPVSRAVATLASALATRQGVRVGLNLEEDIETSPEVRNALLHVLSEAVSNAIRHGAAEQIEVTLERRGGIYMRINDDGTGFDPTCTNGAGSDRTSGLGLVGMRERVEALGGTFALRSAIGHGTAIEVTIR